jgi:PPOX class probable F420-dependent enzyme
MAVQIRSDLQDLLERPIVAALVTLMPDNQPQATPVWFNWDGTHIWVNTARDRQKDHNMMARSQVTVLIIDHENPYRWLELRGTVDEITEEGAVDHINALSKRYFGREDFYGNNPELRHKETRVIYKIKPYHTTPH